MSSAHHLEFGILIHLNEEWALGYDDLQWIVMCRRTSRRDGYRWRQVSFIASKKVVVERVLREKGIEPTPEAQQALHQLPNRFKAWRQQRLQTETSASTTARPFSAGADGPNPVTRTPRHKLRPPVICLGIGSTPQSRRIAQSRRRPKVAQR